MSSAHPVSGIPASLVAARNYYQRSLTDVPAKAFTRLSETVGLFPAPRDFG